MSLLVQKGSPIQARFKVKSELKITQTVSVEACRHWSPDSEARQSHAEGKVTAGGQGGAWEGAGGRRERSRGDAIRVIMQHQDHDASELPPGSLGWHERHVEEKRDQ